MNVVAITILGSDLLPFTNGAAGETVISSLFSYYAPPTKERGIKEKEHTMCFLDFGTGGKGTLKSVL